MKMDLKRCFTTHTLLHNLLGVGIGLILVALVPAFLANALVLGVLAVVVALAADAFMVK